MLFWFGFFAPCKNNFIVLYEYQYTSFPTGCIHNKIFDSQTPHGRTSSVA